jgi:hypothetical protein
LERAPQRLARAGEMGLDSSIRARQPFDMAARQV